MSITDETEHDPSEDPTEEDHDEGTSLPNRRILLWQIVQALRKMGRAATIAEITDHVADSLELTQQQRTVMIPSGSRTQFQNRIMWAALHLRHLGVVDYPKSGYRELTEVGLRVDSEQLETLRIQYEANKTQDRPSETESSKIESDGLRSHLVEMIDRFKQETGYPTEAHLEQKRLRAEWAKKLAPENIASFSRSDLTAVTNHTIWFGQYLNPVEGEMKWIRDLDDSAYEQLLDNINYLCSSDDELWFRYDQLTARTSPRKVNGFGDQNVSRVLAICLPKDFLPIRVQYDPWGRERMLRRLSLPDPQGSTHGHRVVDSNDRLKNHLEPYFDDDTLGMATFLGWFLAQDSPDTPGLGLAGLATRLLVDVEFLADIVSLLEDKGQVILYGPPGTGKTYLARELAKELAPDDSCRTLVQFHPSTSYEDFFEGYRPAGTGDDGGIRYELTPGPLARMAKRAENAPPDQRHVMIIDEINRGNLPRVLGELLFLLEYRNETVQTLYRPEEPFALPENLWFIGTMNTADRSIALVDAALRRRFHFVPFFPDREPMAGLLGRWLERQDEPAWVGHLVDAVNDELKTELEGSHLLLGPSHFMKEYGDSPDEQHEQLRRIWKYNIEPFIEDQFFGAPDRIEHFRFDAVMTRYGPASRSEAEVTDGERAPESADGSENADVAADGDA